MTLSDLATRPSADEGLPREALAAWVQLPAITLGACASGAYAWALILGNRYPGGCIAATLPPDASLRMLREQAARYLELTSRLPRLRALHSVVIPPGSADPVLCDVRAVLA